MQRVSATYLYDEFEFINRHDDSTDVINVRMPQRILVSNQNVTDVTASVVSLDLSCHSQDNVLTPLAQEATVLRPSATFLFLLGYDEQRFSLRDGDEVCELTVDASPNYLIYRAL